MLLQVKYYGAFGKTSDAEYWGGGDLFDSKYEVTNGKMDSTNDLISTPKKGVKMT